jgi:hypothetical protein
VGILTAAEPTLEQTELLVARLGSGAFRDREAASRELDALGPAALPALRRAIATGDAETRQRAAEVLERINDRLAAARILTPTTVEFKYDNKPLEDAVREFNRKCGATLTLHDATQNKFRGRTITASTNGPVPFWDAVELFCRKADLHEWDTYSRVAGLNPQQQAAQMIGQPAFAGQVIVRSGRVRNNAVAPNSIVLLDGPAASLASCRNGALRVRIAPPGTTIEGVPQAAADEVLLPLQFSGEPKLAWQGIVDIRVDRALDDRGRFLTASQAVREVTVSEDETVWVNVNGMIMEQPRQRAYPFGVRVRRGEKPSARLSELSGAVAAQVRVTEPLVNTDDPLKSIGQTFRGKAGVEVKITSASKASNGDVTVGAEVRMTMEMLGGPNAIGFAGAPMMQRQSGSNSILGGNADYQGLSLEDAKGKRFTAGRGLVAQNQFAVDGISFQYTVTFKPADAGQEAARLVFTGAHPATIEIPFALKDVPLQ